MNVIGHNSLIFTPPHGLHKKSERMKELPVAVPIAQRRTKISSFFFNSFASLCRKVAAGRDGLYSLLNKL